MIYKYVRRKNYIIRSNKIRETVIDKVFKKKKKIP